MIILRMDYRILYAPGYLAYENGYGEEADIRIIFYY